MLKFSKPSSFGESSPADSKPAPASERSSFASRTAAAQVPEDAELQGTLSFSQALEFNGRFEGKLEAGGPLTLQSKAQIKGEIKARSSIVIHGKMLGNIEASGVVELKSGAVLIGDVISEGLVIQSGAVFNGTSSNTQSSASKADFNTLFSRLA
jgi:cytoskeletal protein CcmA (bactofilin family)